MARPEQPISTIEPALEQLAEWLRRQRRAAGLTHREMARKSGHVFSATTYSRATSGARIPRLPVVEAYATACGAPVWRARELWRAARGAEHPRAGVLRPDQVRDRAGLIKALQELYRLAGAMPVEDMERRAGEHGELPHSTVRRMLAGNSMLAVDQLMVFLTVCGVTDHDDRDQWRSAWQRARRRLDAQRMRGHLTRMHETSAHRRRRAHDERARDERGPAAGGGPEIQWVTPYPAVGLAMPRNQDKSLPVP
ncbi:helix-turn-helix domain-containing protein [Streptomyces sp. BG9H]|uniref:Helix-turn-helix domain-containing protein n=1 Tax=Streptomyces anatolicus TaxID=2675858 RepID=A0ABS6YLE9_9ACTN|nr:helix-turn-helix transcriptional regulator [Streptomyces anatolicus]MBW5421905.1 helix-turn-helix domain-containing protein [Streptomyces anatolicus]